MSEVSPCCGAEYTDNDNGPSYCCDAPIINGLCSRKKCLDHAEPAEGFVCGNCEDFFEEPEEYNDYKDRIRDNALEDSADAKRKYNE